VTPFRDLPIRRKLVAMTIASSAVALALASGGFLVWDLVAFRSEIERDLNAQARVLGENSAAAMTFGDTRAAGETLAALALRPRVLIGCLFTPDAQLFATYHRGPETSCPSKPADGTTFGWTEARLVAPVVLDGSRLGTIFIHRELADVYVRMVVGFAALAVLLVICTTVAVAIGNRLQRSIADPLLHLADTARAISDTKDYSLRAPTGSNDEVGVVVRAFNDMLERIEERTAELSRTNRELEREVEERKRMEAERSMLLARERDANRLKDEFLATLSHELRTPLNAVLGWTRVLRSRQVPPETTTRALESIERNARAQARLIEDLLEISRIVTGKLRLRVRPADLAAIVSAAVEVVQPAAAAKRIRLISDLGNGPAMTSGDPDRLQQVVWNLLSNAVKFTPNNGEIRVRVERDNGYVLTVQDSGVGIEPSFLPHMFERFRQADGSASREHGGLGLGLAIVRQIVEMHGGTVKAYSRGKDTGATFEVRLPSQLPAEGFAIARDRPPSVPQPLPEDGQLLDGINVLVVDDEEDARVLLEATLRGYGANVWTATSVDEALETFERAAPDVLLSDIGMPVQDGYALIHQIRARAASRGGLTPAVALTAYASPTDRLSTLAAGYQAHVAKPFEPEDVAALVRRLARRESRT
jgi:signal transduction histidine kinase/ActR/RegA family two-component response regulator